MDKVRCNILIIGTLASGSSALKDMLREYDNINVIPGEFDDYRAPGLIADLLSPDTSEFPDAVKEFLSRRSPLNRLIYKSELWKVVSGSLPGSFWRKGQSGKIKYLKTYLIRLNQIKLLEKLHKGLVSDISFEKKIGLANKWIQSVGDFHAGETEFVLFDQPLLPWSDASLWMKVFSPFKAICVVRDPKDQIAEIVRRGIIYSPFRSPFLNYPQVNIMSVYGKSRRSMMHFHTDALKGRLEKVIGLIDSIPRDKFLLIDFESLAVNYDSYKNLIDDFLEIDESHHKLKKKYYDPDVAIRNSIGMYKNYLNDEDLEDLKEIEMLYKDKIKSRIN
jgi:hypothetical protein